MNNALAELINRGLIKQSTDIAALDKMMNEHKAVYCGFDPTADSLHVGSLLPLTVMKVLKSHGVRVIALVGGATGRIGDPSFKAQERSLLDEETVEKNIEGITKVIRSVLGDDVKIVNNYSWIKDISMLEFLRVYGKCFTVNNMINKESVRQRIERPDQGISFTEFAYPIMQGLDFECLFEMHDCTMQMGGSDQWGNMIAGTDVIHKLHGNDAECGVFTLPLLTKDDGTKFGKSESGTVWLSADKTSPFEIFQFWKNISDAETIQMYQYFKPWTTVTDDDFSEMMVKDTPKTKTNFALAMVELIHGIDMAVDVADLAYALFEGKFSFHTDELQKFVGAGLEECEWTTNLVETLVNSGLATSRKMAREFIKNKAVKVNGEIVGEDFDVESILSIPSNLFLLQRGRKNFVVIHKGE